MHDDGCLYQDDPATLVAAHTEYAVTRDPRVREQLVEAYAGTVRAVARRFAGRGESEDDLAQVAFIGLLEALDRFDPSRGLPFRAFAVPTMVGELKRHFRDRRWRMRVPRALQERYLEVRRVRDELAQDLGRVPSVADIAAALELPRDDVVEALEAGATFNMSSLDGVCTGSVVVAAGGPERGYQAVDDRLHVEALLARLEDRQRLVLDLRFGAELTQAEIGRRVGIGQMQVSRMLSRTLAALRTVALETETNEVVGMES